MDYKQIIELIFLILTSLGSVISVIGILITKLKGLSIIQIFKHLKGIIKYVQEKEAEPTIIDLIDEHKNK